MPSALEPLFPFPYFQRAAFSGAQIWAGARRDDRLVTRLHCDIATSFLAQVYGRKRVRLFSPVERYRLYAMPAFNFYASSMSRGPISLDFLNSRGRAMWTSWLALGIC